MATKRQRGKRVQWRVKHCRGLLPWILARNGMVRGYFSRKVEAVRAGRNCARGEHLSTMKPTQLLIHGRDGRIQSEATYGNDPRPYGHQKPRRDEG